MPGATAGARSVIITVAPCATAWPAKPSPWTPRARQGEERLARADGPAVGIDAFDGAAAAPLPGARPFQQFL